MRRNKAQGQRAAIGPDGYQEATVVVADGYKPDAIVVAKGKPVRLNFRREEVGGCADTVTLPDFKKSATLPTGKTVAVEFVPERAGTFAFSCGMDMYRGQIIVE